MATVPVQIVKYNDSMRYQLIEVWEQSVRATHHFLLPADIDYYKSIVDTIDFNAFVVYCAMSSQSLIGFVGVADEKVEMLFLHPDFRGKGLGKMLMQFAIQELNASKVDVNEQNNDAVAFYRYCGFIPYDRTEKDSEGKDYPILKMKLASSN